MMTSDATSPKAEADSVADLLKRGPFPPALALRIAARAADALHEAHARGTLHLDLTPANILLDADRRPRLAGFGAARDESLAVGHRSPEQLFSSPDEVDARSDVYSLASVLHEMLTGRPPFDDLTRLELEDPAPTGVSKAVDRVLFRALAKDPAHRFQTAADLARALRAARPRILPVALAAAALFLAALSVPVPKPPALPAPDFGDLAERLVLQPGPASGEVFARVGPRPSDPTACALLGAAHLVHGNRRLARDYFARARALGAEPGPDPLGRLVAADTDDRFERAAARFLGGPP